MSLFSLAVSNFKRSVREFAMLVLSLSFSVFIFFNFQNVIYSNSICGFPFLLCLVCCQCFSQSEKKGDRHLYFYGPG